MPVSYFVLLKCCYEEYFRLAGKILANNGLSYSLSVLVLSGVWDGTAAGRRVRRLRRVFGGLGPTALLPARRCLRGADRTEGADR